MNKITLKSSLHKFIDQIDNQQLLEEYYLEMKNIIQKAHVGIWDSLSEDQKKEVLLSYEESDDASQLLDNEMVMAKYKKWL
jgi:hypothetical protein